jgi:ABC-2 type transport system permease protein
MSTMRLVAVQEWRLLWRNTVGRLAVALVLTLSVVAALTSIAHRGQGDALRARFQSDADAAFDGAPARHPHRMVHYGHFVFRPLPPLAGFDPGVDAYTGHALFLEGHRQNSANFGDARQSSLLIRFGQLTPAFVLQTLAPLLLVFVGFGCLARERERGTLRQLVAQGVPPGALLGGKLLALGGLAALLLLPAAATLLWLVVGAGAPAAATALLLGGYAAYLGIWVLAVVSVSALAGQARNALLALIGLWGLTVVLLPRVAPDLARAAIPLPSRLEGELAIARELTEIGDAHDPDDPHFAEFKAGVLREYGVDDVAKLPVNYRGLLAVEGERLTAALFERYMERDFATQRRQNRLADLFGLASPTIAVRRLSLAASGMDLEGHRRFLTQAERYRYDIVQRLNRLQAEALSFDDDGNRYRDVEAARRVRIDPQNWRDVPDFAYQPTPLRENLLAALPGAALLLAWIAVLAFILRGVARRIGRFA